MRLKLVPDFSSDTLRLLSDADEVQIETSRGSRPEPRRTTIWIVVDHDTVYVRSVRGSDGAWYRAIVKEPTARLVADGTLLDVRSTSVADAHEIERVSEAIRRKYNDRWPGPTAAMLRPEVLPTTLRLDPA